MDMRKAASTAAYAAAYYLAAHQNTARKFHLANLPHDTTACHLPHETRETS